MVKRLVEIHTVEIVAIKVNDGLVVHLASDWIDSQIEIIPMIPSAPRRRTIRLSKNLEDILFMHPFRRYAIPSPKGMKQIMQRSVEYDAELQQKQEAEADGNDRTEKPRSGLANEHSSRPN